MQRPFRFIKNMLACTTEYDSASLAGLNARKTYHLILANHNLFDQFGMTQLDKVGVVESRHYFTTSNSGEAFNAFKVSMFDRHDAASANSCSGQL